MLLLEFQSFLLDGLLNTLFLSSVMIAGGTFFAVIFAVGLSAQSAWLRGPVYGLVECLRDIPLMVTVLMVYFVLPHAGLSFNPFWSSALSVSVWGGANGAHIIRAGLLSVPSGQREAALSSGLRGWKGLFLVILPQAMPVILPPYVSLVTSLTQASSLGAVLGVNELLRSAQILIEQTTIARGGSPAYLVYGSILVVYFALCWSISALGAKLERHFAKPYQRTNGKTGLAKPAVALQISTT
ncbi:amino acid ABC transporter permease [Neorhizobium galegae]|uniref:amino acid ABC transporter permease n=1 Tax=Neorhizobium galegae TaxID=399 RepID=UPI0006229F6F|nr:amino acid ABC transporter permease [Neorhizobium galegae]CDZ58439.1 Amine acid ABC transporter, permease protein, 3-TM region, His/Glu/Gln/Arg/opine family [Neorhizobium galegae bv. orientalis]KAB1121565.1 amino acid ABC transporter permease [Neorhizobium galegae]MCQ1570416.1 amino acid ABC transporter permease [Neorhizobium galegae]MCQ1809348.1 amino acid ABC transporter permease [Neorhizobium galegae]MCQ1838442.1 amino acid ABC transporter permease [Neorhizobium galegae]